MAHAKLPIVADPQLSLPSFAWPACRSTRFALDAEAFVKRGRLKPEDEGNREKIAEAVEALVDNFTEGRLVPAGDA